MAVTNRDTIIQLYLAGKELTPSLVTNKMVCQPDVLQFIKKVGSGTQGSVYLATYVGSDSQNVELAVKVTERRTIDLITIDISSLDGMELSTATPSVIKQLHTKGLVPQTITPTIAYGQHVSPTYTLSRNDDLTDLIVIYTDLWPMLSITPRLMTQLEKGNPSLAKKWGLNQPIYVAYDAAVSEGLIALYTSTLIPTCYHFVDTIGLYTCEQTSVYPMGAHYLVMEQIQDNLDTMYNTLDTRTRLVLLFMVVFVLYVFQLHGIVHGDFHLGNIFYVDTADADVEGVASADTFIYRIGKDTYYLPAIKIIPKVGDFGFSEKWSPPAIFNASTDLRARYNEDLSRYLVETFQDEDLNDYRWPIAEQVFDTTAVYLGDAAAPDALSPELFSTVFGEFMQEPTNAVSVTLGQV